MQYGAALRRIGGRREPSETECGNLAGPELGLGLDRDISMTRTTICLYFAP